MNLNLIFPHTKLEVEGQELTNLLGGKGGGLYWMAKQGINVPPFVIIPTSHYNDFVTDANAIRMAVVEQWKEIAAYFTGIFGYLPLLSVRSGARVSCPGMMDTLLNVGLDAQTYDFWEDKLGVECAQDCLRRLKEMYSDTVLGLPKEDVVTTLPSAQEQVVESVLAVFKSWNTNRAKVYRKLNNIPEEWGTAVVIQAMVFGNLNAASATGVLFTRNPDTGENIVTGEFLPNAQGEDVVAGTATPLPLKDMQFWNGAVYDELKTTVQKLEGLRRDVQDVEFTIQDGKLYILQTRNAKRSAKAAIRIALDMATEGILTPQEAVQRVTAKQYDLACQPVIDPAFTDPANFTGIPACSGVATGIVVKSAQAAINCQQPCILVTAETTPDDIAGMHAAKGVLTMTGGATSHAAVVARGMNKPCVVGLSATLAIFPEGATITIDGATGRVWLQAVPVVSPDADPVLADFFTLLRDAHQAVVIGEDSKETLVIPFAYNGEEDFQEAVKAVVEKAATVDQLMIILRQPPCPVTEQFDAIFGTQRLDEDVVAIAFNKEIGKQPKKIRDKIMVVTSAQMSHANTLKTITTLEDLILAAGAIVMAATTIPAPVLQKVLEWKGQEITPVAIGVLATGQKSYVSKAQLIAQGLA